MLDIEWHYTMSDLCGLMARVDDLPLFSVSLDLTDPAAFAVINATMAVATKRGTYLCVSATLNDAERRVEKPALAIAYRAVLAALANR